MLNDVDVEELARVMWEADHSEKHLLPKWDELQACDKVLKQDWRTMARAAAAWFEKHGWRKEVSA